MVDLVLIVLLASRLLCGLEWVELFTCVCFGNCWFVIVVPWLVWLGNWFAFAFCFGCFDCVFGLGVCWCCSIVLCLLVVLGFVVLLWGLAF